MINYAAQYHIGREMMMRGIRKPDVFDVTFDPVEDLYDITWKDKKGDEFSFSIQDLTNAEELNALAVNMMIVQ